MAKYTTSVRSICEVNSGLTESKGQANVNQIVESARSSIFDFDYPIYDEAYRPVLEKKILKHYYTREIGAETVGLWKMFLDTRMNEIMPYYNKLYESELLEFNPLHDVDYTREYEKTGEETGVESSATHDLGTDRMTGTVVDEGENTSTLDKTGTVGDSGSSSSTNEMDGTVSDAGTSGNTRTDNLTKTNDLHTSDSDTTNKRDKNDHWDYYSDTPQGSVGNLENLTYLTNARHITDDGNGSTSSSTKTGSNTGTVRDTGTVQDSGTSSNTRTYDTIETLRGTSSNTTTYNTKDETEGTDENTRTFNTLNTKENNGTVNANKTLNSTDEYIEHVVGKMGGGTYMKMIKELRENILNIDMLIIRDLQDLFFGLWE